MLTPDGNFEVLCINKIYAQSVTKNKCINKIAKSLLRKANKKLLSYKKLKQRPILARFSEINLRLIYTAHICLSLDLASLMFRCVASKKSQHLDQIFTRYETEWKSITFKQRISTQIQLYLFNIFKRFFGYAHVNVFYEISSLHIFHCFYLFFQNINKNQLGKEKGQKTTQ